MSKITYKSLRSILDEAEGAGFTLTPKQGLNYVLTLSGKSFNLKAYDEGSKKELDRLIAGGLTAKSLVSTLSSYTQIEYDNAEDFINTFFEFWLANTSRTQYFFSDFLVQIIPQLDLKGLGVTREWQLKR